MPLTTEPIQIKNPQSKTLPEFGRVKDVQDRYGVKRGLLYRWIKDGKVKSVLIREEGNIQGIRLIHLASVGNFINSQMQHSTTN